MPQNFVQQDSNMKHEDYTIGWVCALTVEIAAAVGMLDEEHEGLAKPAFDRNNYTLGRIGKHNVVIAGLPTGAIGSSAAAVVATSMAASFPRLRFALLVGIGGGVPSSEHDIRLGDVVVSTPNNMHGGVIQYDFGKVFAGGRFTRTGILDAPPPVLLGASSELRAKHLIGEPGLLHFIEESVKKYPKLGNRYNYPGEERDLLFESTYEHAGFSSTCERCDHDRIVLRPKRNSQTPEIHYGSIATGTVVIKDAMVRDQLGAELGVLCIEVEAAGLMNSFPSLVIRGISDYSDSHKNKDWQFYAAVNAAAYAKELICTVPAHAVQASDTVADTFDLDINRGDPFQSADINSETSSVSSATLIDESDQSLINTAAEEVAHVLLEDVRFKGLCSIGVIRQTPPVFRRNISTVLVDFGRTMRKTARTPLERAVAWILIHRRDNIAFTIFETVSPAQDQAAKTLRLDQIPVAEQELLQRFINERFGITQPKMSLQAPLQAEDVDYEAQEQAEVEREDEDPPPELSSLAEPHNLQQILCEGEASWGARKKLKLAVCPITSQQLEKVLQRHIPRDAGSHAVNCLIEWELLAYMDSESVLESELDSVFTITGDLDCAQAVRLGDYMSNRWTTGNAMLSAIKTLIGPFFHGAHGKNKEVEPAIIIELETDHKIRMETQYMQNNKEQIMVQISGSFHQILTALEQLSWLGATLRPGAGDGLAVSEISFRSRQIEVESSFEQLFVLSLIDPTEGPKPMPGDPGQCWTSIFTESVLAYGFPLSSKSRPEEILGLEIPFEIMTSFAKVKYPIHFRERIVFAGDSTLLIPILSIDNSIQWHYLKGEDCFENAKQYLKTMDAKLQTLNAEAMTASRAFLGFSRNSDVVIGTKPYSETIILDSEVPATGPKLALNLEGPVGAAVSPPYSSLTAGTTWKFRGGEFGQIKDEQITLDDRIKRAGATPALIYDAEACRAFLVPELSVIVCMVSAYIKSRGDMNGEIPYAEPSPDGGDAAYNVIVAKQTEPVSFKIGNPRTYLEIVEDFVKIFEQRKMQTRARRAEVEVSLKVGLRGWDFVDLQEKTFEFFERELPTSVLQRRPVWWKLFKKSGVMVLFGRNTGNPIGKATTDDGHAFCTAWADLPTGEHLLLAHMVSLTKLRSITCKKPNQNTGYYMLTDKLAWARPMDSQLFENCVEGNLCNPMQTMQNQSVFRYWRYIGYLKHPGAMHERGAVLFGDQPSSFQRRPCHLIQKQPPEQVQNGQLQEVHNEPPQEGQNDQPERIQVQQFSLSVIFLISATAGLLAFVLSRCLT